MIKKILLCISSDLGLKIYRLIKKHDVDIYSSNLNIKLKENFKVAKKKRERGANANISYILNKKDFNNSLIKSKKKYDFIILVYWPWLVEKECFAKFCKSINFHPSFLPYGRGWYPHIHAQIKKFIYGVTLHEINPNIDAGDIWCQKKILIPNFCKGNEIYKIAEKEIYWLFKNNYRKIFNKTLFSFKQSKVTRYLSKKEITTLDKINLNSKMKVIDLINHIKIRTFKNNPFCYFIYKNQKRKIKITIY